MITIDQFISQLTHGLYETPKKGRYTPTLVVGLGGAGLGVLRVLKKCLNRLQTPEVYLLGIDSDTGENERWPELPRLAASEITILNPEIALGVMERAESGESDVAFVNEFLPNECGTLKGIHTNVRNKIQTNVGAGQFRRAGKLLFRANANDGARIWSTFKELRANLQGMHSRLEKEHGGVTVDNKTRILVVSSLAGGTGAGMLLDCLALLRMEFAGDLDHITLIGILPGDVLDDRLSDPVNEKKVTRGNAIALLRELEAVQQGTTDREFVFDPQTRYTQKAGHSLVQGVFLVDNRLMDRTPVNSWTDLWKAVGYFLYALTGTGFGQSDESGKINAFTLDTLANGAKKTGNIFSVFGVSVLAYPIDDMSAYSFRCALDEYITRLMAKSDTDEKGFNAAVGSVAGMVRLATLDQFLSPFMSYVKSKITDAFFGEDVNERKVLLSLNDADFLSRGKQRRDGIDGILREHEQYLHRVGDGICAEASQGVAMAVRRSATKNIVQTRAMATAFVKLLRSLKQEHAEATRARIKTSEIDKQITGLEKPIVDRFTLFDGKYRKSYLAATQQLLRAKTAGFLDHFIGETINNLEKNLQDVLNEVDAVIGNLKVIQTHNRDEIATLMRVTRFSNVQPAMSCEEFDVWRKTATSLTPKTEFDLSCLNCETLFREALTPLWDGIHQQLLDLNLARDFQNKKEQVEPRIQAMDRVSIPLMEFTCSARSEDAQRKPQKFVAGCWTDKDTALRAAFKSVGQSAPVEVAISDKGLAICIQTRQGVAIKDWAGYEVARRCYKENPWYFHVFSSEDMDALPTMDEVSAEDTVVQGLFGLGLMCELISVRGSNYYPNIKHDRNPQIDVRRYLTYAKERGMCARAIIDRKLAQEAAVQHLRPKQETVLGKSLAEALKAFASVAQTELRQTVETLCEDLVSLIGRTEFQSLVAQFKKDQDAELAAHKSRDEARGDLMDQILTATMRYAQNIR